MPVLYEENIPTLLAEINKRINEKVGQEYNFYIDSTVSDPAKIITWAEIFNSTTSAEWLTELGIKPCVVRNGTVLYYLNPDNFNYTASGANADITTLGNDVMIEIPRLGVRCVKISDTKVCVTITKKPNATGFDYRAFSYNDYNDSSKLYVGAYAGFLSSGKLYSSSGKIPSVNSTLANFRAGATARGNGYGAITYSILTLLQCIYCLMYRHTNSQTVVGAGYTSVSHSEPIVTGASNTYGMNSELCTGTEQTDSHHHVKFCGIESLWGNVFTFEDGLIKDNFNAIKVARTLVDCADVSKYDTIDSSYTVEGNGFVKKMMCENGSIFLPKDLDGSSASYFCDYSSVRAGEAISVFGGGYMSSLYSGIFYRNFQVATNGTGAQYGSRLVYLAR